MQSAKPISIDIKCHRQNDEALLLASGKFECNFFTNKTKSGDTITVSPDFLLLHGQFKLCHCY